MTVFDREVHTLFTQLAPLAQGALQSPQWLGFCVMSVQAPKHHLRPGSMPAAQASCSTQPPPVPSGT